MPSRKDYDAFLADVREQTGIAAMAADEFGLVTVRVDDKYNVNLQFVEPTGRMLCFIELTVLPKDASKEVYRDLLAGGLFGKDTAGGFFTLEAESESVVYNYFFDLEEAAKDVDDFVSTLEKMLQLCDSWCERIDSKLSDSASQAQNEPLAGGFLSQHHIRP